MYIVGGKILTMAEQDYDNGVIRIVDGKITEIGDCGEIVVEPTEGEEVITVHGVLIMPGIIEAHCHMGIMEEKKGMEGDDCNETVDPITPWLRGLDAINSMDAAFDDAVRAGITAAMIGPGSSNVVGGQFALLKICALAMVAEFASDICRDAGESSLAKRIDTGVRIGIVASAIPSAGNILLSIAELIR